jgi:hypothetical protein
MNIEFELSFYISGESYAGIYIPMFAGLEGLSRFSLVNIEFPGKKQQNERKTGNFERK